MKRISVKGYKAINSEKEFDLAPINLLIGPNGSGKSSIINSLVLTKGMFSLDLSKVENNNKHGESVNEDIFRTPTYSYKFEDRLVNPLDSIGRFNSKDFNDHSSKKTKQFSFKLPIELEYFPDKFNIELQYYLNERNNALLNGIRIVNIENEKELFSLQSPNLEGFARKRDNDKSSNYHPIFDSILKIDVDYILTFLKALKINNPTLSKKDFDLAELIIKDEDLSDEQRAEMQKILDENKQEDLSFITHLTKDFHAEDKCNLNDSRTVQNSDSGLRVLELYNQIENLDYFDYYSTDIDSVNKGKLDIRENKDLYIITEELESRWLNSLKTGVKGKWSGNNVAFIMRLFDKNNSDFVFQDIERLYPVKEDSLRLESFNLRRSSSRKTELVFNQLLIKNIFNAIYKLNSEINELIYIPPNRVKSYKSQNNYLDEEFTTAFIDRLNKIQYQDKFAKPILHFIKYWISEFKLENKLQINTIDDLISLFNSKGAEDRLVNSDLGYGIGQLLPLVFMLSLYSENYNQKNEDFLVIDYGDDFNIKNSGLKNCFLIEEPEANLHPNYQSKLADIFIDASSKFGHQFIIETHSEYFVRKFQYWVAKGKIKPSDVNIYYFDNRNDDERVNDVIIKKISINSDGSLSSSFGSGFFDETDKIALGILDLNSKNLN